ncbi:hypothetical protein BGZ94_006195 [Podila epigama]|nr:hypothetical protein BGZ94_006195 [Podila epigama]
MTLVNGIAIEPREIADMAAAGPPVKRKIHNPHALSAIDERFSTCGSNNDLFQISGISSNRHLCSGCKACINIEGLLRAPVTQGATLNLEVSKFYIPLFSKKFDLCSLLESVPGTPRCPINPNHNGLRACLPLSSKFITDIPASLRVTAYDASNQQLFCVTGTATIESNCPNTVGPGSYSCTH